MPMLVTQCSVVVVREGKRKPLPIGKPFNFTEQEVKDITAVQADALRPPVNESADEVDEEELPSDEQIDEENRRGHAEQAEALMEKTGNKVIAQAGGKKVAAHKAAATKVDDL